MEFSGNEVTCVCSTNLTSLLPRWEIDFETYLITDLPLGFEESGYNLSFILYEDNVTVRCTFVDINLRNYDSNIGIAVPLPPFG